MSEDPKSNFEREREEIQRRHREVLDKFSKKSKKDREETLIHAGILTSDLKLAPPYRPGCEGEEKVGARS